MAQVGAKSDLTESKKVSKQDVEEFYKKHISADVPENFLFETSSKTLENIKPAFMTFLSQVHEQELLVLQLEVSKSLANEEKKKQMDKGNSVLSFLIPF